MSTKKCTGPCGRELSLDCFWKQKGSSDGVRSQCKDCMKQYNKKYYSENDARLKQYQKEYNSIHKEKVTERQRRYYNAHQEKLRAKQKRYYYSHKAESLASNQRWLSRNRERYAALKKMYNSDHRQELAEKKRLYREENKEYISLLQKQYRDSHKEEIAEYKKQHYASNKERIFARQKQYSQTPAGKLAIRTSTINRRARKKKALGSHTSQEIQEQLARQKHKCYYCKTKLGSKRSSYHADHIVPLSKGGTNYIDNIVLACSTCNLKKSNKLLHEWLDAGRLL